MAGTPTRSTHSGQPSRASPTTDSRGHGTAARARHSARCSSPTAACVAERTRLINTLQALHTTGPTALRELHGSGSGKQLATRALTRRRRDSIQPEQVTLELLSDYAERAADLTRSAHAYKAKLDKLLTSLDHKLYLTEPGSGPISAAKLLVGDTHRLPAEAAFARCNGTAPLPASTSQTTRHRLERGGNRQANNAIHTIALARVSSDAETRAYLNRNSQEGKTNREAMRSLKRHLSPQPLQTTHHHRLDVSKAIAELVSPRRPEGTQGSDRNRERRSAQHRP